MFRVEVLVLIAMLFTLGFTLYEGATGGSIAIVEGTPCLFSIECQEERDLPATYVPKDRRL